MFLINYIWTTRPLVILLSCICFIIEMACMIHMIKINTVTNYPNSYEFRVLSASILIVASLFLLCYALTGYQIAKALHDGYAVYINGTEIKPTDLDNGLPDIADCQTLKDKKIMLITTVDTNNAAHEETKTENYFNKFD